MAESRKPKPKARADARTKLEAFMKTALAKEFDHLFS
jgi:hypothetical protein